MQSCLPYTSMCSIPFVPYRFEMFELLRISIFSLFKKKKKKAQTASKAFQRALQAAEKRASGPPGFLHAPHPAPAEAAGIIRRSWSFPGAGSSRGFPKRSRPFAASAQTAAEWLHVGRKKPPGKLARWWMAVPCRSRGTGGSSLFFLPTKPGFSTELEEFCTGTPQMSKGCRKRILGLVRADFLPSKYTSSCKSCGLSQ